MSILKWGFCFSVMMLTLWACSRLKSQPITDEGAKTNLAGKTNSGLPVKPAVASMCIKCLLQVVQGTRSYHENTTAFLPQNITYSVNRIKANPQADFNDSTNFYSLKVDVRENENGEDRKLCSYVYNNQDGTVRLLNTEPKQPGETSSITPDMLKKIRSNCY